jgi:hypothetical protein
MVMEGIIQQKFNELYSSEKLRQKLLEVASIDFYRRQRGRAPIGFVESMENYLAWLMLYGLDELNLPREVLIREQIKISMSNGIPISLKPSLTLMDENAKPEEILKVITLTNQGQQILNNPLSNVVGDWLKIGVNNLPIKSYIFVSISIDLSTFSLQNLWRRLLTIGKNLHKSLDLRWFVPIPITFVPPFKNTYTTYVFANYLYRFKSTVNSKKSDKGSEE